MVESNSSLVTEVRYEDCDYDHPIRVKIDFEDFPMDSIFQVIAHCPPLLVF